MINEIWKDIPGYEGIYQVSDQGRVKGLDRIIYDKNGKVRHIYGKILKQTFNKRCKYFHITLHKNKKVKTILIHQLVAIVFLEHIRNGPNNVVDHINNIKTDNRLINLQILNIRDNIIKSIDKSKKSSSYTGVMLCKKTLKWRSQIVINKKQKHLGCFDTEYEAHLQYQKELSKIKKDL